MTMCPSKASRNRSAWLIGLPILSVRYNAASSTVSHGRRPNIARDEGGTWPERRIAVLGAKGDDICRLRRREGRPRRHQLATTLEEVGSVVGGLGLVSNCVC